MDIEHFSKHTPVYGPDARLAWGRIQVLILFIPGLLCLSLSNSKSARIPEETLVYSGLGVTLLLLVLGIRYSHILTSRRFGPRIRRKIEEVYDQRNANLPLVGIAPGAKPRTFNNDSAWDVGLLVFESGAMRFYGDRCTFELAAEQGRDVTVTPHIPLGCLPRLLLRWDDGSGEADQVLMIEAWGVASRREIPERTAQLKTALDNWIRAGGGNPDENQLGLPPRPGEV